MKIRIRPSKISTNPCISDKIVTFIQILIWPFIDIWIQRCYHVIMRSGGGGAGVTWSHDNSPEPVLPPSAVPASATGASTVQFGKTLYIIRSIWTLCIMLLDLLLFQSLVLLLCSKLNVFIHSNNLVCEVQCGVAMSTSLARSGHGHCHWLLVPVGGNLAMVARLVLGLYQVSLMTNTQLHQ